MGVSLIKLTENTNIHGPILIARSRNVFIKCFWGLAFLAGCVWTVFQIVNLTMTLIEQEVTTTLHVEQVYSAEDFNHAFSPQYCAQDWLDFELLANENVNLFAFLLATTKMGALNYPTYLKLYNLLSYEDAKNVNGSYEGRDDAFLTPTKIRFKMTESEANQLVSSEIAKFAAKDELDLIRKFTKTFSGEHAGEVTPRLGAMCESVETDSGETNEFLFTAYHGSSAAPEELAPFEMILSVGDASELEHESPTLSPQLDRMLHYAEENYQRSMETETAIGVAHAAFLQYFVSINAKRRSRIITRNQKCVDYEIGVENTMKLKRICGYGCEKFNFNSSAKMTAETFEKLFESIVKYEKYFYFDVLGTSTSTEAAHEGLFELSSTSKSKHEVHECVDNCDSMLSSCHEREISSRFESITTVKDVKNVELDHSCLKQPWCKARHFHFQIDQFITLRESRKMTIVDYMGAVGGSLGMFLGASVISLIQLSLNCFTICDKTDDVEEAKVAA